MNRPVRCPWMLPALCLWMGGSLPAAEYWVSPFGKDDGAGTREAPWRTLHRAGSVAAAGDTVFLQAGTYREILRPLNSGEPGRPVRFLGAPGERPILSGADELAGAWEVHQGSIHALRTERKFIQLFVDGMMMPEARWPNAPPGDLMSYRRAAAGEGTGYDILADGNLPSGDWNGGIVVLWPGSRWVSLTRRISGYQPGKSFRFDPGTEPKVQDPYHPSDPYQPRAGNPYFLTGCLAGLDSPGEWFHDEQSRTVYLWTMDHRTPAAHVITVKQRDFAVDFSNRSFVELRGVDISGAAVSMADAKGCVLEDCHLRYVDHARSWESGKPPTACNVVTGQGNEWRRCLISGAATAGLRMAGKDNRLTNCIIRDVNYLGSGCGGLDLNHSSGAVVSRCTISRTGRDGIQHHGSRRIRIEHCDIFHCNLLNNDAGAIYAWGTDGQGGVMAYNWVHDHFGDSTVGIYLDNFDQNFAVHHNLVWNCSGSGIRLNSDALHHLVANNTIQGVQMPFGTYCYAGRTPNMKGTRILNNLVNESMNPGDPREFVQGELGPELSHWGHGALDEDGYPVAGSAAIDAGIEIPGITDGFRGNAPDLGAYEAGGPRWSAGADWQDREAPAVPCRNLAFAPRPPPGERTMITDGLALWLDAADRSTLDLDPGGRVTAWRDKSAAKRVSVPVSPDGPVHWVKEGINGKPAVRGEGSGSLQIENLAGDPGPVTVLVVSQSLTARGPDWQRIAGSDTGEGEEWVLPNWIILAPGGEHPAVWPPRLFVFQQRGGAALARITVLGGSAGRGNALGGDVAEVLIFSRVLRFDEMDALRRYLKEKWGLREP